MKNEKIGMVGIIAWSHNRWKGFDIEGFSKRTEYGFEYVKQTGMAYDWWNFYEGFDERYYIGHIETGGKKPKFRRGLIIFISRNVNDKKHYFVGFYGKGEYSENGFKTGKKMVELLPENYKLWAKEAINKQDIEEKYAKYVGEALFGNTEYVSGYRGDKEFSAVFDEKGFIEIQASDIGFKEFGRPTFSYIGNTERVKPEKVCLLLLKAKQKHEELLKKDIPEDRRKDINDVIRKIDWVLETYFEGGALCMVEIVERLREILRRGKEKYNRIWSENWEEVHKLHLEKLNKIIQEDVIQDRQWEGAKKEIDKLFRWGAGGVSAIDENSYKQYREFLAKLKDAGSKENIVNVIREYLGKVSGLEVKSAFSCAAILYPNLFAPLWGSTSGGGVFNRSNIEFLGLLSEDLRSIETTIDGYFDFLNKLETAAREEGIDNLLEAAFYMMKFGSQSPAPVQSLRSYYESKSYLFHSSLISQFYTALKTKGFVILSGLSGTGKTKLATEIAGLLRYPQLLTAWGDEDSEEELRKALEEIYKTIENNGYSTLIWGPAGKANKAKKLFILWVTYNNKVRAGFFIEKAYTKDEIEANPNLKKRLQKGYEWVKEVYNNGYKNKDAFSEDLKRRKKEHKSVVILEVSYIYIKELELSKFEKIGGGHPVIPQSGYSEVTLKDVPEDLPDKFITKNSLFLSVRPDWRDSKPLLGYYNPLDGKYYETELLKFILRAKEDYERNRKDAMPYIVILDEMNLAHVEYYFADFLSVLESGRDRSGFTREGIKLHDMDEVAKKQGVPKEIKLPPNLYILGTVNVDETTYMFSPKVLDRAFTIEFRDVDLQGYPPENAESFELVELQKAILDDLRRGGEFTAYAKDKINQAVNELKGTPYWRFLNELNKALEPYDLHFGYRVVDEIALFYKNAKESQERGIVEFKDDDEIFDLAILTKILPKFHGNRRRLEDPLKLALKYCLESDSNLKIDELDGEKVKDLLENWQSKQLEFKFKYTAKKVLRMLRQLYELGFVSFF